MSTRNLHTPTTAITAEILIEGPLGTLSAEKFFSLQSLLEDVHRVALAIRLKFSLNSDTVNSVTA